MNSIYSDGVIDIKEIPECNVLEIDQENIRVGAAVTLNQVPDSNYYPLLSKVIREIADRTARNKITIGGKICGKIQFREAVLPLLISNCFVIIAGSKGIKTYPLNNIFDEKLKLKPDEFLVQIIIPAARLDQRIRFAISGTANFPFRSIEMEEEINKYNSSAEARAENAIESIPYPIKDNLFGSAEYRKHLFKNALIEIIETLEVKNEGI